MTARLEAAAAAVDAAAELTAGAAAHLARDAAEDGRISVAKLDRQQVLAYDLAHLASALEGCRVMLDYGGHGELEGMLAGAFVADVVADVAGRIVARDEVWGLSADVLRPALDFVADRRSPEFLESIAAGLPEIGGFGLSVPEEYGGFAAGGEHDYLGMVVATEELSWGSLGVGGSLITRPEILTRAIVQGGTEEQKQRWLPGIASGELMVGVMVTEPDYGSDVAHIKVTATPTEGGYLISGVKTWATFAGRANVLMLLARTDADRTSGHRGLSLFVVEKEPAAGHAFAFEQPGGGKIEGRAIDTLGYRGMHSYEVAFDDWFVPAENLVGGEAGLGRGFYLQMEGFENGRLQTAARAVGLMQAAFEAGLAYAQERRVFGQSVFDYQLSQAKLARMAALIQAGRQFSYDVARRVAKGEGALQASMVKAYVCRTAEWVTRRSSRCRVTSSTPASCRSSRAPTRPCASG